MKSDSGACASKHCREPLLGHHLPQPVGKAAVAEIEAAGATLHLETKLDEVKGVSEHRGCGPCGGSTPQTFRET